MIMFSRIKGVVYRNILWAFRSPFRLFDVIFWPFILFFMLTLFLSSVGGNEEFFGVIVLSVIAWRAIYFVSFETTAIFIEDHWDRSLPNMLVSPIRVHELAIGGAITGVLKTIVVIFLVLTVGSLFYNVALDDPLTFLIGVLFLSIVGFSVGLVHFGLACVFDKRNVFTLSFLVPELVGLISGPYFNIEDMFPEWLVAILNLFPTTHAFNVIKSIFGMAKADYQMLFITTFFWLAIALLVNRYLYDLGRKKGTLTKV
ncbi:ABC transporter permease [Candidatus Micrarchaeota archaeon]|nr:ABC transporter permease [Candidatus Micrarchaeota archaeon]